MVEAVMLWNEPNNLSHWDFHIDPEWMMFAEMTIAAAGAIRKINPNLKIVLGGMSPVDANFVRLLAGHIIGITTWDWCGKTAAPNQRLRVSRKAWEFASGSTMRIQG